MRFKFSPHILVPFILLCAFALRFYRLGVSSLWYDETVSTFLARQDLIDLTRHTAGDIHPPLYYYLLHFWIQFAGSSEFAFAFVSLAFDIILIALVYRVAREWLNANVALIAAFLVAISPYNLWYSQEVRMYTMGATLGLTSVYFFVRLLCRQSTVDSRQKFLPRDFIAYAIVSALGMYTLYYFAFLLVFENLVALVWLIRNSKFAIQNFKSQFGIWDLGFWIWFCSQLAIVALYLPWLGVAFRQATDPPVPPWRSFTSLPQVLIESFSALTLGQSVDPMIVSPILLIAASVIVIALWRGGQRSTIGGLFLLGYTFVPLFVIYSLSLWKPLYHVRYVFTYSPAFYILLALGLHRIANSKFRIAKYAVLFTVYCSLFTFSAYSANNFWFDSKYAKDDLRGALNYVAEHWRPGDAILINAGYTYTAFDYYYRQPIAWRGRLADYTPRDATTGAVVLQTGSIGGAQNLGWGNPESDFYATTADATRAALDRVFATHARVWQVRLYDTVVDPDGVIRDYLAQNARIIDDQGFAGESYMRVQGYTSRAPITLPANMIVRDLLIGGRIVLLGFDPGSLTVHAGDPIDVKIYWQPKEPTNIDAQLFVGLFAEDGALVASTNEIPIGNARGTSRWMPDEILREPARLNTSRDLASGRYILRVSLYNPLTHEPLQVPSGEWVVDNAQIRLANVEIEK